MAQNITTIVLKTTDEQGGTGDQEYTVGDFTENQDKLAKKRKDLRIAAVESVALTTAQELFEVVKYEVNNYVSLTENYKLQVSMDNVSTAISKVNSLASSVMSGAISGAQMGGGTGAAVGAAIAAVQSVASNALEVLKAHSSQNLSLAASNVQTGYSQSRLGLIDNGRGTQN